MRNGRLARRRHQQQEGAPLPDQPGRVQAHRQAVAVAAWAEVVELAAPVDAIDRAQAPGAAEPAARRSGRRPAVAPVWCTGCRPLSWVSTVMARSEVAVAGRRQVTRRPARACTGKRLRYRPHRNNQSRFAHDSEIVT